MDRVKEYIHRKLIERKGYRPLSPGPPSPPPSREKVRYWECPDEKARYWECPDEKASNHHVPHRHHQNRQHVHHHHQRHQCHQSISHS